MKKLTALMLSLLMLFVLTACGAVSQPAAEEEADLSFLEDIELIEDTSLEVIEVADMSMPDVSFTDEGTTYTEGDDSQTVSYDSGDFTIDEDGTYTSYEEVALYIATYEHLPDNFITKKEARELGWSGGGLDDYAYGMSIGGDYFGNNEGLLPKAKGRTYHECDIDTLHAKKRGAERIVYSNDGLVYYTDDHYETFTLLYGEE